MPPIRLRRLLLLPRRGRPLAAGLARAASSASSFQHAPAPPRLPAAQQAEFERLQRAVAARLADPTPLPHETTPRQQPPPQQQQQQQQQQQPRPIPAPSPASTSRHATTATTTTISAAAAAAADIVLPAAVRRGAKPEFEGDTNPRTGEVGGPKTEPLRWGAGGDWSYNGRVTDF